MNPIVFVLPWPQSSLSPNTRQHWTKLAKAKKVYRQLCWMLVSDSHLTPPPHDGKLTLTLRFFPPDRRRYDRDNLLARMKAGLDGVCSAFGIDDHRFSSITVADGEVGKPGCVRVQIDDAATETPG